MYGLKIFSTKSQVAHIRAEMEANSSLTNKGGYNAEIKIQKLRRKLKWFLINACFFKENRIRNH